LDRPGVFPRLALWFRRSSLSNQLHAVAVVFGFHRLQSGPVKEAATESRWLLDDPYEVEQTNPTQAPHRQCSRIAGAPVKDVMEVAFSHFC